jgi:superfamily II DNA or RNA helicase
VLCEIDYQTAVENKYIVPVEAYYIEIPKTEIKGNERSWASMYSELVVMNETRNHIISDLLVSLKDKSTLCLVKEIKHGSALGGYFAHGENSDTPHLITLFNRGKLKTLVGTTGVLGEGVDTRPAEYVIIAGLGKSRPQFMQQIGRGVRNYPGKTSCKVIIFLDKSHKWTRTHLREQCKILLEYYGVVPSKLEL